MENSVNDTARHFRNESLGSGYYSGHSIEQLGSNVHVHIANLLWTSIIQPPSILQP